MEQISSAETGERLAPQRAQTLRRRFLFHVLVAIYHLLAVLLALASTLKAPFDPREATIASVHHSLFQGLNSCHDISASFLGRIAALNHRINAIIALNSYALQDADQLDRRLWADKSTGPLCCIPVLLKDNFDMANMATTGGSLALADSRPTFDAPVVATLKEAGAIILGKVNLHELALEGLSVSSLGGQTINPYDFTRTPGGSSGGSAAAVAASFAVFATGTDTINSLRNPASANSLFSIRPTRGLISRSGVVPVSYTQDALGPIARTVEDLAIALTVMASVGFDPNDNTTALIPSSSQNLNYGQDLVAIPLGGLRLGVLATLFNRTASLETIPVNIVVDGFIDRLRAAGATVVTIASPVFNSTKILATHDTQKYEYRESMDAYLQLPTVRGNHPTTLNELYSQRSPEAGDNFLVIPHQQDHVRATLASSTGNTTYAMVQAGIRNLTRALHFTLDTYALDALIYPEQQNLVVPIGAGNQYGRNGILAAVTGCPVVTVPAGFSNATETAPVGVPIGVEILGRPWSEQRLLNIALAIERLGTVRRMPVWAKEVIDVGEMMEVPVVTPDKGNISPEYPIGIL